MDGAEIANRMSRTRRMTRVQRASALILIIWLLMAVVAGSACHHHVFRSEANCAVCHFTHQAAQVPVACSSAPLVLFHQGGAVREISRLYAGPELPRSPSRAPPTA
jgi:hypothetical protein